MRTRKLGLLSARRITLKLVIDQPSTLTESNNRLSQCHGTGTKVGDPIEVEALSRVFSGERNDALLLGSVKTNVGHSEAASGIASIIKATIMLETAAIPPTHGLKKINPRIKVNEWNVRVVTKNEPWPGASLGKPRRASINSVCSPLILESQSIVLTEFVVWIWRRKCPCGIRKL